MKTNLTHLSIEELARRFAEICVEQDKADIADDIDKFNELYEQKVAVHVELKSRGVEARSALLKLYEHPNIQVKLEAAKATFAIAPKQARKMIEFVALSNWMPQAADAAGTLRDIDSGFWQPN